MALLVVCISTLMYAASFGAKQGWGSATILGALGIALVSLIAFIAVERKVKEPVVPIYLFSHPRLTATVLQVFDTHGRPPEWDVRSILCQAPQSANSAGRPLERRKADSASGFKTLMRTCVGARLALVSAPLRERAVAIAKQI